jgi:riboflavin synthase
MFTGIIEHVGKVVALTQSGGKGELRAVIGPLAEGTRIGDSVNVNGACLTVARLSSDLAEFDVSGETLRVTTTGALRPGAEVNLERALRVGERLGGHFVLGHVDCVGTVAAITKSTAQVTLTVNAPPHVIAQIIPKGSIAVDGISLTVAELTGDAFSVAIIPHTFANTTLRGKSAGDRVNLELDMIGKYVARLLGRATAAPGEGKLSEEFLAEHGFT